MELGAGSDDTRVGGQFGIFALCAGPVPVVLKTSARKPGANLRVGGIERRSLLQRLVRPRPGLSRRRVALAGASGISGCDFKMCVDKSRVLLERQFQQSPRFEVAFLGR